MFATLAVMRREDLDQLWKLENVRRSLAMLPAMAPGLSREDAILILELLAEQMEAAAK
jgi:hypothetical protein